MSEAEVLEKTGAAIGAVKVMLDALAAMPNADGRAIAVAKTQFETAFLWTANAAAGDGGVLS